MHFVRVEAPLSTPSLTRAGHLTQRFFGSVRAPALDAADIAFVRRHLTDSEQRVWDTLGRADRAESVAVARRTAHALGPDVESRWLAAALLHDVGKVDSGLGTFGRVGATLFAGLMSHGRARRMSNRIGRYVNHDEIGAATLREAGARPETAAWAAAHHRPERYGPTGIPPEVCAALAAADGE
jgi:putative nucleotidyltransferase with HDIG domain